MNKSVFHYKGYSGGIETNAEELCFHGKILFIDDLITYEATTPTLLKKEFESAVDDYITTCIKLKLRQLK